MDLLLESQEYKAMKEKYEKNYFKLCGDYCYYDGEKIKISSSSKIAEQFKNKKISIEHTTQELKKGKINNKTVSISKNFYQIWSEDPNMREYNDIVFNCNLEKVKPDQFNLFDGFNHFSQLPQDDEIVDLEPIFDHMKSLVNDDIDNYNYFISWLAQLIQYPHILPHTALIFITKEGIGKDLFAQFFSNVIHKKYYSITNKLELICGNFNSDLGGKLLYVINETNPVESKERLDDIKFLITAEEIMINGKYKDPVRSQNFCRFMFFTNRLFGFPVEEGNRRPVIFSGSNRYLKEVIGEENNKKYFDGMKAIYKNVKYQNAFLQYLKNLDISNFKPAHFKKSELQNTLEDNAVNPIVSFMASLISKHDDMNEKIKVETPVLLRMFSDYMRERNYKFDYTQRKFNVELKCIFDIDSKKSNGNMFFFYTYGHVKNILIDKYKYTFDNNDDDDDNEKKLEEELDYKALYLEMVEKNKKLKRRIVRLKNKLNSKNISESENDFTEN